MNKYEELVKRLRDAAKMSEALAVLLPHSEGNATAKLYKEAADVIEEEDMAFRHLERDYKELCDHLPKWIPVTERLPEPEWYLVRCNEMLKHVHRIAYYCNSTWYEDGNDITKFVTHWVSLPEPPKEET